MIEHIIDHIQSKGFAVHVYPGFLAISKPGCEKLCGANLSIDPKDITAHTHLDYWFNRADSYMAFIDHSMQSYKELNHV